MSRRTRYPAAVRAAAVALYRQGVGPVEIARLLEIVSHSSVVAWARAAGAEPTLSGRRRPAERQSSN